MYNKYFTMKRSELKEAIKAEIKSVLLEDQSKSAVHSLGKDLYDYLKESIELSKPKETNNKNKEYLYALAQWQALYTRIIQEVEEDEELVLKSYAKTLDLFAKSRGNKSEIYLGTKLNLAYYYFTGLQAQCG